MPTKKKESPDSLSKLKKMNDLLYRISICLTELNDALEKQQKNESKSKRKSSK
jgi:hypothetical protein